MYRSDVTTPWLNEHVVSCLKWPSKAPDLNVIENVWSLTACRVYHSGNQFQSIDRLKNEITNVWHSMDTSYIRSFYHNIPKCLLPTFENGGRETKY